MIELLERGVLALEKLSDENVIEIEGGPPVCPHCGVFDPTVTIDGEFSECKLSKYIIEARCSECEKTMYVVVDSYSMHQTVETVFQEFEARRAENEDE